MITVSEAFILAIFITAAVLGFARGMGTRLTEEGS